MTRNNLAYLLTGLLALLSSLLLVNSGILLARPAPVLSELVAVAQQATRNQCESTLVRLGFTAEGSVGLIAKKSLQGSVAQAAMEVELALQGCPWAELVQACVGTCDDPRKVELQLKVKDSL